RKSPSSDTSRSRAVMASTATGRAMTAITAAAMAVDTVVAMAVVLVEATAATECRRSWASEAAPRRQAPLVACPLLLLNMVGAVWNLRLPAPRHDGNARR